MNTTITVTLPQTSACMSIWQTGTPDIPAGSLKHFWTAYKDGAGKIRHRYLAYLNAYVMPLSDSCYEAPKNAVPTGDDGEYAWTGWHEESCEQCETQWTFGHEVVAWMELPRFVPAE